MAGKRRNDGMRYTTASKVPPIQPHCGSPERSPDAVAAPAISEPARSVDTTLGDVLGKASDQDTPRSESALAPGRPDRAADVIALGHVAGTVG
jgi:hypothetical protein